MSPNLPVGAQIGRYRVEAVVGSGGMASVYRVRQLDLGAVRALKVLHDPSAEARQRLLLEGQVQAAMASPHVVRVFDVVEAADGVGLLLEYVDGPSLAAFLREGPRPPAEALALALGVANGVAAAHAIGVIHRDLKPSNVLLARTATGWMPKVSDFGIAKLLHASGGQHTRSGSVLGSVPYMAPEQLEALPIDERADVWALGCILYELLTAKSAFHQETPAATMRAITTGRFVPVTRLRPELDPAWDAVLGACFAVEPERRIPSVSAFRAALLGVDPTGALAGAAAASGVVVVDGEPEGAGGLPWHTGEPVRPGTPGPATPGTLSPVSSRGTATRSRITPPVVIGLGVLFGGLLALLVLVGGLWWVVRGRTGLTPSGGSRLEPVTVEVVEALPEGTQPEGTLPDGVAPGPGVPAVAAAAVDAPTGGPAPARVPALPAPALSTSGPPPTAETAPLAEVVSPASPLAVDVSPWTPIEPGASPSATQPAVVPASPLTGPATGRVVVRGAAEWQLRRGGVAVDAGAAPPGDYAVWARIAPTDGLKEVARVSVRAGEETVVVCSLLNQSCR